MDKLSIWRAQVTTRSLKQQLGVPLSTPLSASLCQRLVLGDINPSDLQHKNVFELAEATGSFFPAVFTELVENDSTYVLRLTPKELLAIAMFDLDLVDPVIEKLLNFSSACIPIKPEVEQALDYVRARHLNKLE